MLPIKSWRIYYADGSTFTNLDGLWAEAPPFGVQCVVYYHVPDGYKTIDCGERNGDIYYFQGEGVDYRDIKMGLWMDAEGYYRVYDLARQSVAPGDIE